MLIFSAGIKTLSSVNPPNHQMLILTLQYADLNCEDDL